jgi:hypothetical protein
MLRLSQAKAFTKKEAHAELLQLMEEANYFDSKSVCVDYLTLERLFKMQLPAQSKIAKNAFDWVAKACSKNDRTPGLQYVYVLDTVMYGCDHHRVHWANTDLLNGLYDAKSGIRSDSNDKYPDVKRVIADAMTGSLSLGDTVISKTPQSVHAGFAVYPVGETHVQKSFLDAAMNGSESVELNRKPNSKYSGIWGNSEHGSFVIMPIE